MITVDTMKSLEGKVLDAVETDPENNRRWAVQSNHASRLGHPCERYLVYRRRHWDQARAFSPQTLMVFERGRMMERYVREFMLRYGRTVGIELLETERTYGNEPFFRDLHISGRIDGIAALNGAKVPVEIKSVSPFAFGGMPLDASELRASKRHWEQCYPAQLTLYELMTEKEQGLFIWANPSTLQMKFSLLPLDYGYAESLLRKAERVNDHLANDTTPDPVEYGPACEMCEFSHICDVTRKLGEGLEVTTDPELDGRLRRYLDLKKQRAEVDKDIREIEAHLKCFDGRKVCTEDFVIDGKWIERKGYEVKASKYWQRTVAPLQPSADGVGVEE